MRIEVDCERIRRNAQVLVQTCGAAGVEIVGVTKACCGNPEVARAMLAGGVRKLAESRLSNIHRLRAAGIDADIMLLRVPRLSEVEEVVALTQISLNSEIEVVAALARAARAQGKTHQVLLMVETGDRREGLMPEETADAVQQIAHLPGIELVGMATNVGCIGGVMPTCENTQLLVDLAEAIEKILGYRFQIISGGHTANIALIQRGELPARINQIRVGEGILLGVDSSTNWQLPCPHQDAFRVYAEVVEIKTKPSLPEGPLGVDAMGRIPQWTDYGQRRRAVLAIGEQDLRIDGLRCLRPGVTIVGASSDHLVVDVTEADPPVHLGEELEFDPIYSAVATAMVSGVPQVIRPVKEL
jgi:ornithine racemase